MDFTETFDMDKLEEMFLNIVIFLNLTKKINPNYFSVMDLEKST